MIQKGNIASVRTPTAAEIPFTMMWADIRSLLCHEFGTPAFNGWIADIVPLALRGGVLELSVATAHKRDWVKTRYADRIRQMWSQRFGTLVRVDITVAAAERKIQPAPAAPVNAPVNANQAADSQPIADTLSSPLDPRFTFDNFVVGKPNELAHAAARRVAESETVAFNPLFFYGGVGLGKTHLMHAIAAAIRVRAPHRKVLYMSAEKFMYQFVRALRFKDTMSFKEQFRSVDVLMIDDIQFICGKESTQEEFFHTFNALVDQNKQIVISADKSPSDLDGLEDRLRSRLGWGLVADIHPTTYELRLGILEQKREMLKRAVPQDVLEFLAHKITSNVRELEGALNRIIAHAELTGAGIAVTIDMAQDLLQDLLRANDRRISVEDIQRKVAEHYNVRLSDMHSPRRARTVVRPRQVAMYLSKALTEYSLPDIGRKFGGRDHTTIMHGVRKVEELMIADRALKEDVDLLRRAMGG